MTSSDLSGEASRVGPQAEGVPVQASAKLGPHPIPVLVPPVLVPPVSAPESGSVRAADGSTVTWTTAANGTVTAVGSAGHNKLNQRWRKPAAFLAALWAALTTLTLASTAAMASIPQPGGGGPATGRKARRPSRRRS